MTELQKRVITGIGGLVLMLSCILWTPYSFGVLFLVITVLGLWEFYSNLEKGGYQPQKFLGTALGALIYIANFFFAESIAKCEHIQLTWVLYLIPVSCVFFLVELYKKNESPFTNISFTLSGIIYIAFPFGLLNYIVMFPNYLCTDFYHPEIFIGFLFLIWAGDIGAFFVGRRLGKHKLFARISPKKTWEGFFGGMAFALIISIGVFTVLSLDFWKNYGFTFASVTLVDWIVLSMIITIFGTLGDLVESQFKRGLEIKDSGSILPGHGGILDRFDSLVLSTPFVFSYLKLFT